MSVFDILKEKLEQKKDICIDLSNEYRKSQKRVSTGYANEALGMRIAIEIVNQVEQEYNNGWIPCAAGLPPVPEINPVFDNKTLELYLVTEAYAPYPFRAFWNGRCFTDGLNIINAIAWQQLPEAYKPKEES